MGDSPDDDFPEDEIGENEEIEEMGEQSIEGGEEMFETTISEEEDPKVKRQRRKKEISAILKLIDLVPKRTMHEKLRYRYTSKLSKIVQSWMKLYNLRGLDYYHYLMMMLVFSIMKMPEGPKKRRKKKKRSAPMVFADTENQFSEEDGTDSDNPYMEYSEELKKSYPELIENIKRKEVARQENNLINIKKLDNAYKAYQEQKKRKEEEEQAERMCFLERKDSSSKEKDSSFCEFLTKEGFSTLPPKSVPSEIFAKFGTDRENFYKDFPVMDEEDLKKLYDRLVHKDDHQVEEEEDYDEILKRRGRFPFIPQWQKNDGEEEGDNINLAKWEHEYWKWMEENEGKNIGKKKEKKTEDEMELCQLMLVRCGTSWRQELGYTEGWSDTERLGKKGRRNMEKVAFKILKRGYKFDYVLTSNLGRSWRTADLMLSGSGQEKMIRNSCWELNPRHRGKMEGETYLGTASRWGWLPEEWFTFTAPPPIGPRDPMPYNMAEADPSIPQTLPRTESVYHVQERVEFVWDLVRQKFMEEGKRTILICAHKDSIEALLYHIYGFCPTDFTAWHPSYTTPLILMWYKQGKEFFPAFVDFLCDIDEADRHTENLTVCWYERFVDQGLLDYNTLSEIKKKMDRGKKPPDLRKLWEERFNKTLREFENNAEQIGQKIRMMDSWLKRGYIVTPDEELKITEDNTVFKEFMEQMETAEKAKDPLSDALTLKEQIMWIVNRKVMPLELKIKNLKLLQEFLFRETGPETKEMLEKYIEQYEKILDDQNKFKQSLIDEQKRPEEKFKNNPPKCFSELKTPQDWVWAARNKKLPGGVKIPRKLLFDDWEDDSIEEFENREAEEKIEEEIEEEEQFLIEESPGETV